MELRNKFILAAVLFVASTSFAGTWIVGPGKGSHASANLAEGFEGTGAPTNWSDLSTGGNFVNWDYTTSPIAGAQSMFLQDTAGSTRLALYNFPSLEDEIWVAWRYKASADPAAAVVMMTVIDVSQNTLAFVRTQTDGTVVILVTSTASATLIDLTPGTSYRFKARWKKGTGANEEFQLWAAAEATGAWSTSVSQTNGTSTVQADAVYFFAQANYNMDQTIDNVLVKTSDISWSELD